MDYVLNAAGNKDKQANRQHHVVIQQYTTGGHFSKDCSCL